MPGLRGHRYLFGVTGTVLLAQAFLVETAILAIYGTYFTDSIVKILESCRISRKEARFVGSID
jgi:hypothetical protein